MTSHRSDDLTILQGSTWAVVIPVVASDGSTPANLTGWTIRAQVRKMVASTEILHEWTSALGNASIVSPGIKLTVSAAASTAWTWREGVYDVEIVNPSGQVIRLTQGKITVDPEVTR